MVLVIGEPTAPARCAEVDTLELSRCSRLTRTQRLALGEQVAEMARQASELRELLGDIARARAATEARPWRARRPEPSASCVAARQLLLRACELLDHGLPGPALDRMRSAAAELKPKAAPAPKVATGGGSR